jgi:dTMP kinase
MFITFEGVEGSGKTTQVQMLADFFAKTLQVRPIVVREPGGTPLAEQARAIFLDTKLAPSPITETFLLEAARSDLAERVLKPALETGQVVICDRYIDSTLAYQGNGRGLPRDDLKVLNAIATRGIRLPDITFILDLDPASGLRRKFRAAEQIHRLELEDIGFHQRVRGCFRELAALEPRRFRILNADLPPLDLHSLVVNELRLLAERMPFLPAGSKARR